MTRSTRHNVRILIVAVLAASTAGCRKKSPETTPAPATQPAAEPTSTNPVDDDAARRAQEAERARRDQEERERMAREAAERINRVLSAPVYFDFDRSDLSAEARARLDEKLDVLRQNATVQIRVEGHTDWRGSDEYNMALGLRRAGAVRRYFSQRGIDENRIEIVSLGEERPACQEPDESCWRLNRRAEFVVATP